MTARVVKDYERNPGSVRVFWQDCDCPWWTKTCEELHGRSATVPHDVLRQYSDKADQS